MRILLTLLFLKTTLVHSQTINCCDSLIKAIKEKTVKPVCRKPIKGQNHDIVICIDNSHSANNYGLGQRGQMDSLSPTQYSGPIAVIPTDSTIINRLASMKRVLEKIDSKTTINPWLPLIASIIGGVMVWLGQFFDRKSKSKIDLKKELTEQYTKMELLLLGLKNSLKELSTHKNLRELYWNYYIDEFEATDKNIENEKKYLADHYTSCQSIITTSLKIGEAVSEYYSVASKFNVLSDSSLDLTFISEFLSKMDFSDAKKIAKGVSADKALEEYEINNKALAAEYIGLLSKFDALNTTIKSLIK